MQPVSRNDLTDYNQIVIDWTALAPGDDGDSQILGYNVQWKLTSDVTWIDLVLPETSFTELQTKAVDNLVRGESYSFQIRARNIYGFGPFSDTQDILAANYPSPPLIATTETVLTLVKITFLSAEDNGVPISSYDVELKKADGEYLASPECDASLVAIADNYWQC